MAEKEGSDLKISFDWKNAKEFLIKYQVVLLLLIPIILSVWFRAYPFNLPVTDEWGKSAVYESVKQNIVNNVNANYPDLLEQNKNILVEKEFQRVLKENKAEIDQQIESASQYFKSTMQDEQGHTYLPDIDTYLWYTQAKNYLKNGYMGDEMIDGVSVQTLRDGRLGVRADFTFDPFLMAAFYRIGSFFDSDLSLMTAAFYPPLILVTLAVIPAFFIGRKFGGNIAGLFAGIIVAINNSLLARSSAGFADTDYFQAFFPLVIIWTFIGAVEALTSKKNYKGFALMGLTGFIIGVYTKAWMGWWHIFDFILASLAISLAAQIVINRKEIKKGFASFISNPAIKNPIISIITIIVSTGIFASWFLSFKRFSTAPLEPLGFMKIKEVGIASLWPNVFTTVAEFNAPPLKDIINQMGGSIFFLIALAGIVLIVLPTILKKNNGNDENSNYLLYGIMLSVWFIGSAYAFTKGSRFAIIMVPAFAIAFGAGISKIYEYASKACIEKLNFNATISKIVIIAAICLLFISPIKAANSTATYEIPLMNDAWYDTLIEIKNSSTDAITTSWWDFGHWFVALTERKVTFDGGDQGRRIHWVGKTLLAEDEDLAVGLLRMLNCKQDEAYVKLDEYLNNTRNSVNLIYNIVVEDKQTAKKILIENKLTAAQADTILEMTHCDNLLDQYYIASGDMIGKAGVWSHFGSWNFRRAEIYLDVVGKEQAEGVEILKDKFGYSDNEAFSMYYEIQNTPGDQWITGWYSYKSDVTDCNVLSDLIQCGNGLQFNKTSNIAFFMTENGKKYPTSVVYPVEDIDENLNKTYQTLFKETYTEDTIPVSANLIKKESGGFQSILMDDILVNSLFTKLYFHEGRGLKHFELIDKKTQFNGEIIYLYKVNF